MKFSKDDLYNELLNYIYAHNFKDLKVFSKQYLYSIAVPTYHNNAELEQYSIISIDFNNMAKINEKGVAKGDKILHDSIKFMQSSMPSNSSCVRIGGDEFFFILPNTTKENALKYEEKLHLALETNSRKLNGATVTSYCVNSNEAKSLSDMIEFADSAINVLKQNAKSTNSINDWDILQEKIRENFQTFFNNLRFHNFPMKTEHLNNILTKVITSYTPSYTPSVNDTPSAQPSSFAEETYDMHRIKDLKKLNSLLVAQSKTPASHKQISMMDTSLYVSLLNNLVRDPVTMQFNKSYLINQLLEDQHKTYNAMRISSTFVKASNTINSTHSSTDVQIRNLGDQVYSYLNNKFGLNTDTFSELPNNYLIALDGGDMLFLLDRNTKIDGTAIQDINSFFDEQDITHFSHSNLLKLVSSNKFEKINKRNVENVLNNQSELCNENKIPIIENLLNDDIVTDLLSVTLRDTTEFYNKVIPNNNDIASQTRFFNLVLKTILDLYSSLDVQHDNIPDKKVPIVRKIQGKLSSMFNSKNKEALALSEPTIVTNTSINSHQDFVKTVPKANIDHKKANAIVNINDIKNTVKNIEEEK